MKHVAAHGRWHCERAAAETAGFGQLSPQILIYLHYFNGAIVDECPLSRARMQPGQCAGA